MGRFLGTIILFLSASTLLGQDLIPNQRVVLDAPVNSEYTETRPFVSPDGKQLFISRRHTPDNIGGVKDMMDIFRSTRQADGSWSEPENLGPVVNTKKPDALASINEDGSAYYVLNTSKNPKFPLYRIAVNPDGSFGEREKVEVVDFYNDGSYQDYYVSEKFGVILMAIEREDSRGEQDLYVSVRDENGVYGAPLHMGGTINSGKSEFAPFLGPFGRKLYFCSYGFRSLGGSDIYVVERLDDTWTNWGRPNNLGEGINSRGQEIYFSFTQDFRYIYIESWNAEREDRDITQVVFPEDLRPQAPVVEPVPEPVVVAAAEVAPPTLSPEKEAAIDEAAQAQNRQREENREAMALALATDQRSEPYDLDSTEPTPKPTPEPEPIKPTITPEPETPAAAQEVLPEPSQEEPEPSPEIEYIPLDINSPYVKARIHNERTELKYLRNVYFSLGKTGLPDKYLEHLDRIAGLMKQYPEMTLQLEGYTDELGSEQMNLRISKLRAQATAQYMMKKGIAADRILVQGLGEQSPLASNDDELEGREFNRRVEISLIPPRQD